MACLGVHFALSEGEVGRLRSLPESERPRHVSDVIEEYYFSQHQELLAESDKAWEAIHRALTDGHLEYATSTDPLNLVVLGGQQLCPDADHYLSLKTPDQVRDIAPLLAAMTEDDFKRRYFSIDAEDYSHKVDDVDCDYSWEWFQNVRGLWQRAASEGRWILFSVSL